MVADAEVAFIEWLRPVVTEIHAKDDTDTEFTRIYRTGGLTDPGTQLDHPQLVVSCFGAAPPVETSKHTVATTALDALARALDIRGKTLSGVVVTDVIVTAGLQVIPEPSQRWHYQFTVQLTTHPVKE